MANMVSNPPSKKELKELARIHWKQHRPKLFSDLQKSGELEESLNQAAKNTLDAYQNAKNQLLKNGYKPNQAHESAWELVREEWLLRPIEEQSDLENPNQSPSQLDDLLQNPKPPRSIEIEEKN
jgi:hypothetical protein